MPALFDPDDPVSDAEQIAARWADDHGYVGRRRALDDETMADLVSAHLAVLLGQPGESITATDRALRRLRSQGLRTHEAVLAMRRVRTTVEYEAAQIKAALDAIPTVCPDPDTHRNLEINAAQEHRPPAQVDPGACPWCGGRLTLGGVA